MAPSPQRLSVTRRAWPLARPFAISRGSKTTAEVVVAEIFDGDFRGRGECVPYPRYGESVDSVVRALEEMRGAVFSGLDRKELQQAMAAGAARNALDAAFWDLDAKRDNRRAADIAGIGPVELARLGMSRTFQLVNIFPALTVRETLAVAVASRLRRVGNPFRSLTRDDALQADAERIAEVLGLRARLETVASTLSQGEKKLLDIASAFALNPSVILLDEPTSGVSTGEKHAIMEVLVAAAKAAGGDRSHGLHGCRFRPASRESGIDGHGRAECPRRWTVQPAHDRSVRL